MDPLADVRAYYDAGARLNAGLPLYEQPATTNDADFYRYPPLLAILFRPLALLPYEVAALAWEALLIVATVATLLRLRPRGPALLATGMLAMPLLWTLAIGQAQALVTWLLAVRHAVRGGLRRAPQAHAMARGDHLAGASGLGGRAAVRGVDRRAWPWSSSCWSPRTRSRSCRSRPSSRWARS